jgi:phage baseplate assembly protein W
MAEKFINIEFPLKDDNKGKFLKLNDVSEDAIKADIIHLLLTNTNERLYLPSFGANLRKYLFEPNEAKVQSDIKTEIQTAISRFIPNLQVDSIELVPGEQGQTRDEHHVLVKLDYTVTTGAFERSGSVQIEL